MKKRILSFLLVVVMVFTLAPVSAFAVSGYNATAAANYAIKWWNSFNPEWYNWEAAGYGDCTNFVSQCLYAGGLPMTSGWYWNSRADYRGSWTIPQDLMNYLVSSLGCNRIVSPSASQIDIGDVMFYDGDGNGTYEHSAICVKVEGGVPYVCAHSNASYSRGWTMGAARYAVVKMNGTTSGGSTADTTTPGKPAFNSLKSKYPQDSTVTFAWNATENTTHYNFWLYKKNNSGNWVEYKHSKYVTSGFSLIPESGEYRALLQAYNSDAWKNDNSDWLYTESDYFYFTVAGKHVCNFDGAYKWTWTAHPHYKCYECSICGEIHENRNEPTMSSACETCIANHEHDRGEYLWEWTAHPHYKCYQCSFCGQEWADRSQPMFWESCLECHRPSKPSFINMEEEYSTEESVIFSWKACGNTTHYNIWLYREEASDEWKSVAHLCEVNSGVQFDNLSVGCYRALLQAYNSKFFEEDYSDWLYTESDYLYFCVVESACDHEYIAAVTKPTCLEQGYTTYTCACGDSYVADYVAALGHNYVDGKCSRCGDKDPNYNPITNNGKLVVSDARAKAGEEVTASVSIEDNPGIMVMALGIDYDKSKLELIGYEDGIMTGWKVAKSAVWIGADDVSANGVILKLKFKVLEDVEDGDIQVSMLFSEGDIANHNEDIIMPGISNGTITVYSPVPGDVTGDGKVNALDLVRLQRYLSGEDVVIGGSCDITGDGKINALDLVRLQRYLSGEDVAIF